MNTSETARAKADTAFRAFVERPEFPCLAGKGVMHQGSYTIGAYDSLASDSATQTLAFDLDAFAKTLSEPPEHENDLTAFVAVFSGPAPDNEVAFESQLWSQLQQLHDRDSSAEWDPSVSADPEDPRFSFSFGGHAFFVIGLHPRSSRLSRRFEHVALVFNPRVQFDRLREDGRFESMRDAVRARDIALQGNINPNLADFGEASEARQYSGRASNASWKCPFHSHHPK